LEPPWSPSAKSYFTQAILDAVAARGHCDEIVQVLSGVRDAVVAATQELMHGPQIPWTCVSQSVGTRLVWAVSGLPLVAAGSLLESSASGGVPCLGDVVHTVLERLRCQLDSAGIGVNTRGASGSPSPELGRDGLYIPPLARTWLPLDGGGSPVLDYLAVLEGAPGSISPPTPLQDAALAFLSEVSGQRGPPLGDENGHAVLLIVGDAGCGKTSFLHHLALLCALQAAESMDIPVVNAVGNDGQYMAPFVPILLELKRYSAAGSAEESHNGLRDCLAFSLRKDFGLSEAAVNALRGEGSPSGSSRPLRLLVLCDGLDELQGLRKASDVKDIVATLCGGWQWTGCHLAFVVTCRESWLPVPSDVATVFGSHAQPWLLLPFTVDQVSCCLSLCCHAPPCATFRGVTFLGVGLSRHFRRSKLS
jgi:hypothetical protein